MASRHRKYDLLGLILQAIRDDGWNILYLSDPKFHPFRLKIYNDNESFDVRIYIWNLTHGGGKARPADEYRIQITGVSNFEQAKNEKTLILGWWREGGVFAGFDYHKHTGNLGRSPSIQIREEALRKSYQQGISTIIKENDEIAIALRPDFFVEYIKNLEQLHSFGESKNDLEILETLTASPNEINDIQIETVSKKRKIAILNVRRKIRDNSFKSRVLTSYTNRCAFCNIQLKLVDAAHIIPVQYDGTDETSNGIALCALHHRAYDANLITFNEKYQILFSDKSLQKLKTLGLDGGAERFIGDLRAVIHLPPAISDRPHVDYVKTANKIRGWE